MTTAQEVLGGSRGGFELPAVLPVLVQACWFLTENALRP